MNILTDAIFMILAIDKAIEGVYTSPRDYGGQVGSVLVSPDGKIISEAHNRPYEGERRHAEEIVLQNANDLEGATLYVTMEPCNGNPYHHREHCCEQIANSGISRVVIGARKQKYEGGLEYLKDHNVEVDIIENPNLIRLCDLASSAIVDLHFSGKILGRILETRSRITR